jgi:hypothetical protein
MRDGRRECAALAGPAAANYSIACADAMRECRLFACVHLRACVQALIACVLSKRARVHAHTPTWSNVCASIKTCPPLPMSDTTAGEKGGVSSTRW